MGQDGPVSIWTTLCKSEDPLERFSESNLVLETPLLVQASPLSLKAGSTVGSRAPSSQRIPAGVVPCLLRCSEGSRDGPFVAHIGLAAPRAHLAHIPLCPPGPWSRAWAEVRRPECPECGPLRPPDTHVPCGRSDQRRAGDGAEPKSLHSSQFQAKRRTPALLPTAR